jgi:phosphopantothenoylcysteine decarboxylase/phosphopantothenate--cysteine ligase
VRYLSNASSGRMGAALAAAVLEMGHVPVVVSGPVQVDYPSGAEVVNVVTTDEMASACLSLFPRCAGLIAAAAPCDYRPVTVAPQKIKKTGQPLRLELIETADIVAALAGVKSHQWMVAFALETEDPHLRAMQKLERKNCDLIVVNGPSAIHAADTEVVVLDAGGQTAGALAGSKLDVARGILQIVASRLMSPN